ncbi:MAG: hypothetical protein JSW67_08830 [Candidatus Latescibacterota bacterium]|nr:MAG: hypothetical protein JSW67_08830 [Candidatus Latescibacterota bacterium]
MEVDRMWRMLDKAWTGVVALCVLSMPAAAAAGALEEAPSARQKAHADAGATFVAQEQSDPAVCETPRCTAVDGREACTACRFWDYAMLSFPEDAVAFDARVIENGVVLTATSRDPRVQQLLWSVARARHQLLEALRSGQEAPLCAACLVNVEAFDALDLGTKRIPEGVLLMYTSSDPNLVQELQEMVLAGRDLPL